MITTQKAIRKLFWETHPEIDRRKITDYSGKGKMYKTDARVAFCDFVDALHANKEISDNMVQKVTLS